MRTGATRLLGWPGQHHVSVSSVPTSPTATGAAMPVSSSCASWSSSSSQTRWSPGASSSRAPGNSGSSVTPGSTTGAAAAGAAGAGAATTGAAAPGAAEAGAAAAGAAAPGAATAGAAGAGAAAAGADAAGADAAGTAPVAAATAGATPTGAADDRRVSIGGAGLPCRPAVTLTGRSGTSCTGPESGTWGFALRLAPEVAEAVDLWVLLPETGEDSPELLMLARERLGATGGGLLALSLSRVRCDEPAAPGELLGLTVAD